MHYVIWIPLVIIYYVFFAWLSIKNNQAGTMKWFYLMVLVQAFGLWPIVSKFSNRILFDAVLYDIIILVSFMAGMFIFGATTELKPYQVLGFVLAMAGLVLMKI